jgi:fructose-1,6-bisphosphatase/inositol monophosphatase family enzyme
MNNCFRPKVFLSSSFAREDKKLIENIKNLLEEIGLDVYQALIVPKMPEDIFKKILERDLFVAVLTKRSKQKSIDPVSAEVGVAISNNKKVIILSEEGIGIQDFISSYLHIKFDRDALKRNDDDYARMLREQLKKLCVEYGYLKDSLIRPDLAMRLAFARDQVQMLGTKILGYYNDVLYKNEVRNRRVKNFPTKVDLKASEIMKNSIRSNQLTEADEYISEELNDKPVEICNKITANEYVWVLDPLDGTQNFAYGFPFFCVALGLLHNGKPVLGVIYCPCTQELYVGAVGCSSEQIMLREGTKSVLALDKRKQRLEDCIVMTHLSSQQKARKKTISLLDVIGSECRSIRVLGSGQMALIALALGKFDIFFNYRTNIWDVVAGKVILEGAGGYYTSYIAQDNKTWSWKSRGVLAAANSAIGRKFRKLLYRKWKREFPSYPHG